VRRRLAIGAVVVGVFIVLSLAGAFVWTRLGPDPSADARAVADSAVATGDGWLAYGPASADVGVVLYPGARIDAAGYAPVASDLAAATGARVVVSDAPFDIALLDIHAADTVRDAHPDIPRWIVGGHSLGGVAAARYATDPDSGVDGLLLWASYPAGDDELPDDLAAMSITGQRDDVLDRFAYDEARAQLPTDTEHVALPGVTHAQFGDYGLQPGDGTAAVSDEEARAAIVEASSRLVSRVADAAG
jgi:pimeloyl-ACP methyl ester carboxylesterase